MARRDREEDAGGIHHVYARGNNRQLLFLDEEDHRLYLGLLGWVARRQGWNVLAYCLMPNHIHLLVETPEPNLGEGMRELHGRFARAFNGRHFRIGHHFSRRYGNKRVKSDRQLLTVLGYIIANPVAARLVAAPEHWPWSSHAALLSGTSPKWLAISRLMHFLGLWSDPKKAYDAVVAGRTNEEETLK